MVNKYTISDMQNWAESKGGKCLSEKYVNIDTNLTWQCKEGHVWEATPYHIKIGRWCRICSKGVSERICREFFERIFDEKFPSVWPKWLISPKGCRMELDGYCEYLRLAFEYQGQQHYLKKNIFNKRRPISHQQSYDVLKRKLCAEHNVVLIEVPYTIKYEQMAEFIKNECKNKSIQIPKNNQFLDYKFFDIYSPQEIKKIQEIAKSKGGTCLSEHYVQNAVKLKFQCGENHIWETSASAIKSGKWCPYCANVVKLTMDDMTMLAESKGGTCLSTVYYGAFAKLKWQCVVGHVWEAMPTNIQRGTWCPICAKLSSSEKQRNQPRKDGNYETVFQRCLNVAKKRGGKCLSSDYINGKTKLKWQCKEGHEWMAVPFSVMRRNWCPYCSGRVKLTIHDAQKLAESRGGKCLSTDRESTFSKLKWQCKKGHEWTAILNSIKRGSWCPVCAGVAKLTIDDMRKLAEARGGKCLSEKYKGNKLKLKWQCEHGHIWETAPSNILSGAWCHYCAGNVKLALKDVQSLAKIRGGKCLSNIYVNAQSKLKWKCKENHIWEATYSNVSRGKWCPYCAGVVKFTIQDMQKFAESKSGECQSKEYLGYLTRLKWKCKDGHIWEATPRKVKSGRWCRECSKINRRKNG